MGKREYSKYQTDVISSYYNNLDTIMLQKLGEIVTELYLADTEKKQLNFSEKYELPYNLLADTDRKVIEAYGVWGPKKFMGKEYDGIHRTSFVIDEKGMIEDVITKVKTKDHASQVL